MGEIVREAEPDWDQIEFPILDEEKKEAAQCRLVRQVQGTIGHAIDEAKGSVSQMGIVFRLVLNYLVSVVWEGMSVEEVKFRASALGIIEEGTSRFVWPARLALVMNLDWRTVMDWLDCLPQWPTVETSLHHWEYCPVMRLIFRDLKRSDAIRVKRFQPDFNWSIPDENEPQPWNDCDLVNMRMTILRGRKENIKLAEEIDKLKKKVAALIEENKALHMTLEMIVRDKSGSMGEEEDEEEQAKQQVDEEEPPEWQEQEEAPEGEQRQYPYETWRRVFPIPMVSQNPKMTLYDRERRWRWLASLFEMAVEEECGMNSGQRRFDDDMKALGFVLFSLSRQSYGVIQQLFGLPSDTTVWNWSADRRKALSEVLLKGDPSKVVLYLQEYRRLLGIPDGQKIRVNLGVDATSATASGLRDRNTKTGYCFVFVMFPHSAEYPDLVLRSVYSETGSLGPPLKDIREELVRLLTLCDFVVRWKCTDGDTTTNEEHNAFQKVCHGCGTRLPDIVKTMDGRMQERLAEIEWVEATLGGERDLDTPIEIPPAEVLSDDLHSEKNVRSRGAAATDGKTLTVAPGIRGTSAEKLQRYTGGPSGPFGKRRNLDKMSDALAEEALNICTLNAAQEACDIPSWLFMLPSVCISEVFRRKGISVETRLGLLEVAYTALRTVLDNFPKTGSKEGIFENNVTGKGPMEMTLWIRQNIKRTCNLCVALYWEISDWYYDPNCTYPLALSRFGTHSIECHFGITRSIMKGDARLERFLSAQMKAVLVRNIIREYQFPGYLRRFRHNEGGITLTKAAVTIPMKGVDFEQTVDELQKIVLTLTRQSSCKREGSARYKKIAEPVMRTMREYYANLARAGEIKEVHKYSPFSGLGLARWFLHCKSEPRKE
jgi:hypothetical protein